MSRPSTLTLHRYRLGELSSEEAAAVRAWLEQSPADQGRLRAQEAQRREFTLQPVPERIRALAPPPRARRAWVGLPLIAAFAAALVVALPSPDAGDGTRLKGGASVVTVLLEGAGALPEGSPVHVGDRVQVQIEAGPWREAWVTDGQRILGQFPLAPGRAALAPFALAVDDRQGGERLVIVLSERPLSEAEVKSVLRGSNIPGASRVTRLLPKVP